MFHVPVHTLALIDASTSGLRLPRPNKAQCSKRHSRKTLKREWQKSTKSTRRVTSGGALQAFLETRAGEAFRDVLEFLLGTATVQEDGPHGMQTRSYR